MILAAADPNGPANMLAQFLFWTVGIVVLVRIGKAFDAFTTRYFDRKEREATEALADPVLAAHRRKSTRLARALDRGDAQIRLAVQEHEAATRRHQTVPKQLTADRSHR